MTRWDALQALFSHWFVLVCLALLVVTLVVDMLGRAHRNHARGKGTTIRHHDARRR